MTTSSIISVPQFKTKMIRVLSNIVPNCSVEFEAETDRHIKFRLVDDAGRYRTNVISVIRLHRILEKAEVIASIKGAGVPEAGLPSGF